uniref:ANKH inorganic pyrophosphate transport regulator b n=1 Tax=Eptatretus burgeri TaxID=7764 RepID=A0A8C4QMB2_EPTBU
STTLIILLHLWELPSFLLCALNRGIALRPGYTLMKFFTGPMSDFKNVGLVFVRTQRERLKALGCMVAAGLIAAVVQILIASTALGFYVINRLHQVDGIVAKRTRLAFLYLAGYPLIDAVCWIHVGILLKHKYSLVVGCASLTDVGAQVGMRRVCKHTYSLQLSPCRCCLCCVLWWTPGLGEKIVILVFGVEPSFAKLCIAPLHIFWPCVQCLRGWLMSLKQTSMLAPSSVVRIVVLIVSLNVMPYIGVHGASLGIASLLTGFLSEILMVMLATSFVYLRQVPSLNPSFNLHIIFFTFSYVVFCGCWQDRSMVRETC